MAWAGVLILRENVIIMYLSIILDIGLGFIKKFINLGYNLLSHTGSKTSQVCRWKHLYEVSFQ